MEREKNYWVLTKIKIKIFGKFTEAIKGVDEDQLTLWGGKILSFFNNCLDKNEYGMSDIL